MLGFFIMLQSVVLSARRRGRARSLSGQKPNSAAPPDAPQDRAAP